MKAQHVQHEARSVIYLRSQTLLHLQCHEDVCLTTPNIIS